MHILQAPVDFLVLFAVHSTKCPRTTILYYSLHPLSFNMEWMWVRPYVVGIFWESEKCGLPISSLSTKKLKKRSSVLGRTRTSPDRS
jgi:hypothetical protein